LVALVSTKVVVVIEAHDDRQVVLLSNLSSNEKDARTLILTQID
jgi:hypothetical protein